MRDRALALDEEQLSAALVPLDDEPLGCAGDEIRDDGVDGDPPAGDRDPRLPGRDEARREPARSRGPVELERDRHLPDRAVGADGEDVLRRLLEVGARGHVQVRGRAAQVAELDAVANARAGSAPRRRAGTRAGRSRRSGRSRRQSSTARATRAGSDRLPWRRRRAPSSARSPSASSTEPTIRTPSWVSPALVESRIATTGRLAIGEHAPRGLAVVRVAREALGEDQQPLRRARHRDPVSRTAPGRRRRRRRPATGRRRSAGSRRGRRGRRAARRRSPAAIPRPDSIMQPSMTPRPSARAACAIRIASRIPPDFASLMLIPCAISAHAATLSSRWQSSST